MSHRIVIIGGMGPQASLELHRRLLQVAATHGAVNGDDFPEVLHISIPVPDFISSGSHRTGLERIKQSLKGAQFKKGDRMVLACNTAHILLPEIERFCDVQFVSLIDIAIRAVTEQNVSCVGLLTSPTTLKMGLYEKPLLGKGFKIVMPENGELDVLENAIRAVISNKSVETVADKLEPIMKRMRQSGAESIILGCTELSVIFNKTQDKTLIDPFTGVCKQLIEV
ncbi:MAG TPA: amino acid racemase [Candidatus Dormibacteraeota bacterium]|nr:amino acid racemase [Candidatus Dormibacteraeota bacterium]